MGLGHHGLMNLANTLTLFRLFVSPIFYLIYSKHAWFGLSFGPACYLLIGLLAVAELSDFIDGYVARKWGQVTDFGKLFDPMADSIMHTCVYLTFTLPPIGLPIGYIFIFLYRDFLISALRTICALKGTALAARMSGKIKTALIAGAAFVLLILLVLFQGGVLPERELDISSLVVAGIAVLFSLFSGIEYIYANRAQIKGALFSRA